MILDKVFKNNKNIIECIKSDLYFRGYSYIKEVYQQVSLMTTTYNEYTIRFDREPCKLLDNYSSPYYICYMTFINNIGLEVLKISFSEDQAAVILDNLSQFEDFNMFDIDIPMGIGNYRDFYDLSIIRDKEYYNCTLFQRVIGENRIPKLRFTMDQKETNGITDMMYGMYFSYLIDIDCSLSGNCNISLLESVYTKILDQVDYQ